MASGSTLFLDEIGEVSPEVQVMLLRTLQERIIERVGGGMPVPVDVRLVAATHRDLPALVRAGKFRPDLFFRLNVFPIRLPALRERPEDIPALVGHFLAGLRRRMPRPVVGVSAATLRLLAAHPWPGNVRELQNVLERAWIVADGGPLEVDPAWLSPHSLGPSPSIPPPAPAASAWAERERETIREALAACGGRVHGAAGAAARLGLKPSTLYNKMRRLGLRPKPGGTGPEG